MIKKLLAALLASCMILLPVTGCSNRSEESESEEETETVESESSGGRVSAANDQEAAEINRQIDENSVNLIQFDAISAGDTVANIITSEGAIKIKLFPEQAPKTVENFIGLAEDGYYNGITWHRVVDGFMIQTGDPEGTGNGGQSYFSSGPGDPGYFEDEFSMNLWHFRGAVSMAHLEGQENTNTSQFFIVQRNYVTENTVEGMRSIQFPGKVIEKYEEVGGTPHLDWEHTVFGMVADSASMEVVDKIAGVSTQNEVPVEPIIIENVTIETA